MKAALCFIISYDHNLNKEEIWKEWIRPNQDIINVYFHYKDYDKISSNWIKERAIPKDYTVETSYYYVVPAYMSLLSWAEKDDARNQWFCMLTESCVPIISPSRFRRLFFQNYNKSIMRWKPAWWNVKFQKRANLRLLPNEYHIGNDPWFILCKKDVKSCQWFSIETKKIYNTVCAGGLANESVFAIAFKYCQRLPFVKNEVTHLTDWNRRTSSTSPWLFKESTKENIEFIENGLAENKYAIFLRKVATDFPDDVLMKYINKPDEDFESVVFGTSTEFIKQFLFFLFTMIAFKLVMDTIDNNLINLQNNIS